MRRLLVLAAIVAIALVPARAASQRDPGLDLARAAVHEAGFDASTDEVAALHAVIVERCHGDARCQMPRFFAGRTARPWLARLDRSGREPQGWPRFLTRRGLRDPQRVRIVMHAPWSQYRARWIALLDVAERVVRGELDHRCEQAPEAWGGRVDRVRARRLRLVPIACGDTANSFFRFPREGR
jgi:hypothetical protein